jgi:hypothetical protein
VSLLPGHPSERRVLIFASESDRFGGMIACGSGAIHPYNIVGLLFIVNPAITYSFSTRAYVWVK